MKILLNAVLFSSFIILSSCSSGVKEESVFVSIQPQKFFVDKITENKIRCEVMVRNGMSPATYEPLPRQMMAVSDCSIYFYTRVPFEKQWLGKLEDNSPHVKFVDCTEGIKLQPMKDSKEIFDSQSRQEEAHSHKGMLDPHVWLSPKNAKIIGKNILSALLIKYPSDSSFFITNYNLLSAELDSLDNKLREILSKVKNRNFLVFHPSWGYFAAEYGLNQIPVEIEGKEPGIKELSKIISLSKKERIKLIFVQKQFSANSAKAIAENTGAEIVKIDPLAENYIDNLRDVAELFSKYEVRKSD